MKHGWWMALLVVPALLLNSGCEDTAALKRQAKKEADEKAAYKASYESCESTFNSALAKEKANALVEAQALYTSAASEAALNADKPGEYKLQFMNIKSQATAATARVKDTIAQNERIALAKAEEDKRKKEAEAAAAKALADKEKQAAVGGAPTAGVANTMTSVGDATVKTPTPGVAPKPAGGEDDDPLDATPKVGATGAAGAAAADGAKVPGDPFTPLDEKAAFKCYTVKSAKRYVIAYCIVRNNTQKELRIVRPVAEFATAKSENSWPVAAMFEYKDFKTTDWSDLDKDNPNPLGNERISLAPGEAVKLVLMSDKAERDGEYAKAVKLTGGILWNDASETGVINNN